MFTENLIVFLLVDAAALIGALLFVWRAVRRAWRFLGAVRRESLGVAVRRSRRTAHRQAVRCATDVYYYQSRLALMFCANLLAMTGILFEAVGMITQPDPNGILSAETWRMVGGIAMLVFVAFTARALFRTVRLARQVMDIRRKMRVRRSP